MLADLEREYDGRCGEFFRERASAELSRYPSSDFAPPYGAFLASSRTASPSPGEHSSGSTSSTAEIKRISTHPDHRGSGPRSSRRGRTRGCRRAPGLTAVTLTTGPANPRQSRSTSRAAIRPFDTSLPAEQISIHAFDKSLVTEGVRA